MSSSALTDLVPLPIAQAPMAGGGSVPALAVAEAEDPQGMALWAGQGHRMARDPLTGKPAVAPAGGIAAAQAAVGTAAGAGTAFGAGAACGSEG